MDLVRSRLFSFAVSAMLTSAFLATAPDSFIAASAGPQPMAILNAIRAEGWHGAEGLDLPAPSAAPEAAAAPASAPAPTRPITDAQLAKLLAALPTKDGHDQALNMAGTNALGLTKNGEQLTVREIGSTDHGVAYAFAALPGDKGYLIFSIAPDFVRGYWVDKNLVLIAATLKPHGQPWAAMPAADAPAGLDRLLSFWASVADGL